jgi:hypothetical protein
MYNDAGFVRGKKKDSRSGTRKNPAAYSAPKYATAKQADPPATGATAAARSALNPFGNFRRITGQEQPTYEKSRSATGFNNIKNLRGPAEQMALSQAKFATALREGPREILSAYKDAGKQIGTGAKAVSAPMISAGKTTARFGKAMASSLIEHRKATKPIRDMDKIHAKALRANKKFDRNTPEGKAARSAAIHSMNDTLDAMSDSGFITLSESSKKLIIEFFIFLFFYNYFPMLMCK